MAYDAWSREVLCGWKEGIVMDYPILFGVERKTIPIFHSNMIKGLKTSHGTIIVIA
jgi:hypothetical protein